MKAPKLIAREFKVIAIRETPVSAGILYCGEPLGAWHYWNTIIRCAPEYSEQRENLYVLHLNTRLRITGHELIGIGTLNSVHADARSVFRSAIIRNAYGVILMHNHPSGYPVPSKTDIDITRQLRRAARIVQIQLLDHIIVGAGISHCSLRATGYFYERKKQK